MYHKKIGIFGTFPWKHQLLGLESANDRSYPIWSITVGGGNWRLKNDVNFFLHASQLFMHRFKKPYCEIPQKMSVGQDVIWELRQIMIILVNSDVREIVQADK